MFGWIGGYEGLFYGGTGLFYGVGLGDGSTENLNAQFFSKLFLNTNGVISFRSIYLLIDLVFERSFV